MNNQEKRVVVSVVSLSKWRAKPFKVLRSMTYGSIDEVKDAIPSLNGYGLSYDYTGGRA